MLASTDFSESSWTGSGMMEPMYPPAPSMPPAPAPMRDEPMSAPRPKPAKKRKKPSRPKAKKKAGKKRPKARAKRGGKAKCAGAPLGWLDHLLEALPRHVWHPSSEPVKP